MDVNYFNRLPADTRSFIKDIEHKSRTEIAVTLAPQRTNLGCNIKCDGAEILIPPNDCFPPGAVLHELLHIKRIYLEEVPRIVFWKDCSNYEDDLDEELRLNSCLVELDNNLEHLVIVPKEIELRPERKSYWQRRMGQKLDELASDSQQVEIQKENTILHWPFIHHVLTDSMLAARIRALAIKLNVVDEALDFYDEIIPALNSKEEVVRVWMKHFKEIPEEIVCLKYFDIQNRTCREVHVSTANKPVLRNYID